MKVLVLPGDGIGPEIVQAALDVALAADRRFALGLEFQHDDVGFASLHRHGTTLRQEVLERAKQCDGVILGTQSHADYPAPEQGGRSVSAGFRVGLDLYANVRPARTRPFLTSNLRAGRSMDLVIMREATEGFYPDRNMSRGWGEVMPDPDIMASDARCCAQAQHGSAPSLAGKDVANPASMILSVAMLMAWLGKRHERSDLVEAADCLDRSVDGILENPSTRTADLGGTLGCRAFARLVAERVGGQSHVRAQETRHVNGCFFTMVAVDDERKPVPVTPLRPFSPDEKRRHAAATARAELGQQE